MLLVAAGVKLSSPGPVFFRQRRHGLRGEAFEILKFRTMHMHREEDGASLQARRDDERVFRFGRFLRPQQPRRAAAAVHVLSGQIVAGRSAAARRGALTATTRPSSSATCGGTRQARDHRLAQVHGLRGKPKASKR